MNCTALAGKTHVLFWAGRAIPTQSPGAIVEGALPLYLDRHNIPGVTAEDLAAAHAKDVEIEKRYGVKYVTYWFDPAHGTAFCLAEGPNPESVEAVHRDSHGLVAFRVIPVDERSVESFMGAILEPGLGEPFVQTAFRAILFTDIEGSTAHTMRVGDARAVVLLRAHDGIVRAALGIHGGSEVKHTGDGIMASFISAARSVECALEIQRQATQHNAASKEGPWLRIGISVGEPVTEEGDLFGAAVQLAARVCAHGTPGGILVSGAVREVCLGKGFDFEDRGTAQLKGFEEPVRLYSARARG
jgi:class 3 adenylate cyclase